MLRKILRKMFHKMLCKMSLTRNTLKHENLRAANLCGANLFDATLSNAELEAARFRSANLSHANLEFAILEGADFTDADLTGTNFDLAILDGADLSDTLMLDTKITKRQVESADRSRVPAARRALIKTLLSEIDFKIDVEVKETPENRDKILARLDQLSSDVANLAGISKEETPAKTILAAIEASNLTQQIMELVSDAVLDFADMD